MFKFVVKRKSQRGQTLVLTALVLTLVLVPFLFFLIDEAYLFVDAAQMNHDVFISARAGAAAINQSALNNGSFQLYPGSNAASPSASACIDNFAIDTPNPTNATPGQPNYIPPLSGVSHDLTPVTSCVATLTTVTATMTVTVSLPFPSIVGNQLTETYTATLQHGVATPTTG